MEAPMTTTPPATSAIPPFARTAASINPLVIEAALAGGLLRPDDLDLFNGTHLIGLTEALKADPSLPLPPGFLDRLTHEKRWPLLQVPAIAEAIATDLLRDGWTAPPHRLPHPDTPSGPLPPAIEQALITLYTTGRLDRTTLDQIRKRLTFSAAGHRALAHATRLAWAAKTARTRRARGQAPTSPAALAGPPATTDPLIAAIRSSKAARLDRFRLDRLNPRRLQAALPLWLTADLTSASTCSWSPTCPMTPPAPPSRPGDPSAGRSASPSPCLPRS